MDSFFLQTSCDTDGGITLYPLGRPGGIAGAEKLLNYLPTNNKVKPNLRIHNYLTLLTLLVIGKNENGLKTPPSPNFWN